ncbi:MAG: DUF3592 domain-containing protein [Betaproteobacteria bacterium]
MAIDPVLCWAFGGVGVFVEGVALMLARRPLRLLRAGGRARGRLGTTEGEMISNSRGPAWRAYFPPVSFTTAKAEHVTFKSRLGQRKVPEAGAEVDVWYDPGNPQDAEIASFRVLWFFPMVTALAGFPFLLVGIACLT